MSDTPPTFHPTVRRFLEAARALGVDPQVIEPAQTTRTAQDAADVLGCHVGQIVKSLCFTVSGEPVMALVSGANWLDHKKLAAHFSVGRRQVKQANADTVREATGYAIGGVPPFAHATPMSVVIDESLLTFEELWAAAGTPRSLFPLTPQQLVAMSGGEVTDLRKVPKS